MTQTFSSAVEDYAKAIYALEERRRDRSPRPRSPSAWASRPASASGMVRKLERARPGHARALQGRAADRARDAGSRSRCIRHHRLLELYLAESLGVPWDRVHAEAEVLEHVLSEELEALIAAKLGNPTHDPHGDPIPTRRPRDRGDADARASSALEPGATRHVRARLGLRPGDAALPGRARDRARRRRSRSSSKQPFGGPLFVRFGDDVHVARRPARRRDAGGVAGVNPPPACRGRARARRRRAARTSARCAAIRARGPRPRRASRMLGPAFVAAVAYIDPGNFATNIAGGAKYGYMLVWVIVAANLMAMLVQYLSAKTGIATGRNLPELCREHFPRPVTWGLWVQAEVIAIATDLAEFVGAAIALNLLFGVPPFAAGLMTAVVAFAILALQTRGLPPFELAIAGFLGIVFLGFIYDLLQVGVDARRVRRRPDPALRRHGQRSCSPSASSARPSCRTSSTCTRRSRRAASSPRTTRAARAAALPARRRRDRDGPRRHHQPHDARGRRRAVPRHRADRRRLDRGRARRLRARCSAAARRWPSRSRCSPPASRARASAPTPARS